MFPADAGYEPLSSKELDDRLEDWAKWARSPTVGAIGSEVAYMKARHDTPADSAEMTDEVAITERALARVKMEDRAYWNIIEKYYLGRQPVVFIALSIDKPKDRVQSLLDEAIGRVGEHIFLLECQLTSPAGPVE